ncbi:hypothetical protein O5O45_12950 [Hahella aquimaris]|uniref:hypothetical protein n=1 Tax=Hahella sp. HNIBRBA332 TaxID=3015983 RepID=UPI00273BEEAE|nr:hypothetical protein [Hahella sp. HNIBRBA332]WLQ16824.1 hypothetical protein O5O45_12950 [Hahella sp. HNIBRBA332]
MANQDAIPDPKHMFREFSLSLYTGTIGEEGDDLSGLRWQPRKELDARQLVGHVTHYCDWLAEVNEDGGLCINPKIVPDSVGDRMNLAAYYHRKRNAFLSHLLVNKPANNQRFVRLPLRQVVKNQEAAKSFPENRMGDLLTQGFIRRGYAGSPDLAERLNLRDILITMLMYYGGLRISECFQIWLDDVTVVDGQCIVKVYHPSQGLAPDGKSNRATYLKKHYDLLPRQLYRKGSSFHAGWKGPMLTSSTGQFFVLHWFPLGRVDVSS